MKQLTGWHVFGIFACGFGTIIAVNLTLAWNAVHTFPGLEVKNTYVASQAFDADRAAQMALDWEVSAHLKGNVLSLQFTKDGHPLAPTLEQAIFGRATSVAQDQTPAFAFDGQAYVATVDAGEGNWNVRVVARSDDGTRFQQRIVVETDA